MYSMRIVSGMLALLLPFGAYAAKPKAPSQAQQLNAQLSGLVSKMDEQAALTNEQLDDAAGILFAQSRLAYQKSSYDQYALHAEDAGWKDLGMEDIKQQLAPTLCTHIGKAALGVKMLPLSNPAAIHALYEQNEAMRKQPKKRALLRALLGKFAAVESNIAAYGVPGSRVYTVIAASESLKPLVSFQAKLAEYYRSYGWLLAAGSTGIGAGLIYHASQQKTIQVLSPLGRMVKEMALVYAKAKGKKAMSEDSLKSALGLISGKGFKEFEESLAKVEEEAEQEWPVNATPVQKEAREKVAAFDAQWEQLWDQKYAAQERINTEARVAIEEIKARPDAYQAASNSASPMAYSNLENHIPPEYLGMVQFFLASHPQTQTLLSGIGMQGGFNLGSLIARQTGINSAPSLPKNDLLTPQAQEAIEAVERKRSDAIEETELKRDRAAEELLNERAPYDEVVGNPPYNKTWAKKHLGVPLAEIGGGALLATVPWFTWLSALAQTGITKSTYQRIHALEKAMHAQLMHMQETVLIMRETHQVLHERVQELHNTSAYKTLHTLFEASNRSPHDPLRAFLAHMEKDTFKNCKPGEINPDFVQYGSLYTGMKLLKAALPAIIHGYAALGMLDTELVPLHLQNQQLPHGTRWCVPQVVYHASAPQLTLTDGQQILVMHNPVGNSVDLGADKPRTILITGPNGSGKTTLMRTLASAIVLAQSLGIAPASFMRYTPFAYLGTSKDIEDAIMEEASRFAAEVRAIENLKKHVYGLQAGQFAFLFIDEPYSGTTEGVGAHFTTQLISELAHTYTNTIACLASHHQLKFDKLASTTIGHMQVVHNGGNDFTLTFKYLPGVAQWWYADDGRLQGAFAEFFLKRQLAALKKKIVFAAVEASKQKQSSVIVS